VCLGVCGAALSVGLDICFDAIAAANKQRDEQLAGHPDAAKVGAGHVSAGYVCYVCVGCICSCSSLD